MILVTLFVFAFFSWAHITSSRETVGVDSGTNLAVTLVMVVVLCILASFVSLQVAINEIYIHIKFGYGIYQKKILLQDIRSTEIVKNQWYYGWGIRRWFWPHMWIYNIAGLHAVEVVLQNGTTYRIGTDEPQKLHQAILRLVK